MGPENTKTALVVGATGLIGKQLVQRLFDEPSYSLVKVLVRRSLGILNPKLHEIVFDFEHPDLDQVRANDVFCCLGTTIKKAGSQEAFRKVDLTYPLIVARAAKENGARQFLIVTAMGADRNSFFFYNRVKGEVEEELQQLNFYNLRIFRPSLLLGERNERRVGEKIGELLAAVVGPLLIGPLRKYKAIDSAKVARAMALTAQRPGPLVVIYESDELQRF